MNVITIYCIKDRFMPLERSNLDCLAEHIPKSLTTFTVLYYNGDKQMCRKYISFSNYMLSMYATGYLARAKSCHLMGILQMHLA